MINEPAVDNGNVLIQCLFKTSVTFFSPASDLIEVVFFLFLHVCLHLHSEVFIGLVGAGIDEFMSGIPNRWLSESKRMNVRSMVCSY